MNFTTLLVFLGVMGTVCSNPVCPDDCEFAEKCHQQHFKHTLDLHNSSVAPWSLQPDSEEGREPQFIMHAVCKDCTVEHMVAKPIYLSISVYRVMRHSNPSVWCKCPYKLAVGCTCVREQQQ